ncbi:hypothetical protein GCM10009727_43000 [Actinomadura napierensis]|uniref:Uncharacterized protein n=1 Tax=Actinomadura napierensis TaxID=267854 RepID=A0ABN2ZL05_9ACTN
MACFAAPTLHSGQGDGTFITFAPNTDLRRPDVNPYAAIARKAPTARTGSTTDPHIRGLPTGKVPYDNLKAADGRGV